VSDDNVVNGERVGLAGTDSESDAEADEVVQPNFRLSERASGVLLHPTSLPGPHGNGDLGQEARAFVDFLARAGQRWWQMLPVNPVGPGFSPYSGVSAFAGNPLLINLRALVDDGLLEASEVALELPATRALYDASSELRTAVLRRAFVRFRHKTAWFASELAAFRRRARFWLDDYTSFMAIKHARGGAAWTTWDAELARHEPGALTIARHALADDIAYFEFEQFTFDRQWRALRSYAAERGVGLIGDAPIFVAHDSADVWAHQRWFRLDPAGNPTVVSGVPPDYFSKTGQRWGTPLYRWKTLQRDGYRFWVERFRNLMRAFDVIRLDHFIGFARYWEIAAHEETAVHGRWVKGPGQDLFDAAERALGVLPFIAEDLGSVTASVRALRRHNGMPGMRVLQFAFNGDPRDNPFLPHHYIRGCVAYTGTHDNDTSLGWFHELGAEEGPRTPAQTEAERERARNYLFGPSAADDATPIHLSMLRALAASSANTVIAPIQDVLGLGSEARMNTPGIGEGNWLFRVDGDALTPALADWLRKLSETYGRLPKPAAHDSSSTPPK
jgi:4-alpha-glucanotransferase